MSNALFIGKVYHRFNELPSTNDWAAELLAKSKPPEGMVVRADSQSAGRGQYGSRWESAGGKNLTLSVILYPVWLEAQEQFYLSMAVALALRDTVEGRRWTVDGGRRTTNNLENDLDSEISVDKSNLSDSLPLHPLPSAVYRLPSTVYRLPSTVYRLPSTVYRLPSTVYRLPSTVHRLPSTVHRLPSTVYRPPSTVYRLPSAVIKWPNDLYLGNRKAAGILIQNTLSGSHLQSSVVGIGLNVNQMEFDPALPNPTSMALFFGQKFGLDEVADKLFECLEHRYLQLKSGQLAAIKAEYEQSLFRLGEWSRFARAADGTEFSGAIRGVTNSGRLLLETENGEETFETKEIRFRF